MPGNPTPAPSSLSNITQEINRRQRTMHGLAREHLLMIPNPPTQNNGSIPYCASQSSFNYRNFSNVYFIVMTPRDFVIVSKPNRLPSSVSGPECKLLPIDSDIADLFSSSQHCGSTGETPTAPWKRAHNSKIKRTSFLPCIPVTDVFLSDRQ